MWDTMSGNSWAFGLGGDSPDSSDDERPTAQDNDAMQDMIPTRPEENDHSELDHEAGNPHNTETEENADEGYPLPDDLEDTQSQGEDLESALCAIAARARPVPRKQPPQTKKSPRREEDEENGEDAGGDLHHKRPRKSLFGGLEDDEEEEKRFPTPQTSGVSSIGAGTAQEPVHDLGTYDMDGADLNDERVADAEYDDGASPNGYIGSGMHNLSLTQENQDEHNHVEDEPESYNAYDDLDLALSDGRSSRRGSVSPPPRKDDRIPYELRNHMDRLITGACLDADASGDYDPEEEARRAKLEKAKKRERRKSRLARQRPEKVPKCIVRLKFRAFGNVLNVTDCEDNWPEGWSETESDDEDAPRLRYRERSPNWRPQKPIIDPKGIIDDITGYPAARGCRSCRRNGLRCAMIDGGTWPCDDCDSQGLDCEPIILPVKKGKCNNCAETVEDDEENDCSFEMRGLAPHDVCHQCAQAGYDDCIPGDLEGWTIPRIDLDKLAWGPDRKHTSCTECRVKKRKCSVKGRSDTGPCRQCEKRKLHCRFEDEPPKIDRRKKKNRKKAAETMSGDPLAFLREAGWEDLENEDIDSPPRSPSPEPELLVEDAQGHTGVCKDILTYWAHPISFNQKNSTNCKFCSVPFFGMTGYRETKVFVLEWADGLGYTELNGGHHGEYGDTVMCSDCTLARLQKNVCGGHSMARKTNVMDGDAVIDKLIAAQPHSEEFVLLSEELCSFCCGVATWACRRRQPSLAAEEGDDTNMLVGCGLRCCDSCVERLRNEFNNSSTAMAAALDLEPKAGEDISEGTVRADVEFLKEDGLLMRNIEASFSD
jgi:hypothetical protein